MHLDEISRLVHPLVQPVIVSIVEKQEDQNADRHVPQGKFKRIGIDLGISLLPKPDQANRHCSKDKRAVNGKPQLPDDLNSIRDFTGQYAVLVTLFEKLEP